MKINFYKHHALTIFAAVSASFVIIPIVAFATAPHANTVNFIPTVVVTDPTGKSGWQNVSNIQNIDLSNLAQLVEFNKDNSSFINVILEPVVEPTGPVTPTEETPASPEEVQLPEPAGAKDELPPVIEDKKEDKPAPPGQEKKEDEQQPSAWFNNIYNSLTALAQTDGEAQPVEELQELVSNFTIRKDIVLSSFQPDVERDAASKVEAVRLNLSMGITGRLDEDDELLIGYKVGDDGVWSQLASFTQDKDYSNFRNGDYFIYDLPSDTDISQLKVEIFSLSNNDPGIPGYEPLPIYIDAAWVEVDYQDEVEEPGIVEELTEQTEFSLDESPQFEFEYNNENRSTIDELIAFFLGNRNFSVEKAELIDADGNITGIGASIQNKGGGKWVIKLPENQRDIVPGKYILRITASEDGQLYVEDQQFFWGVLAINVNKSVYLPGEESYIQMAALTDTGNTICDANLSLEVTSPNGTVAAPEVKRSGQCGPNNVVDVPDYFAYYEVNEVGTYELKLTRLDENGNEIHHIVSSFVASDSMPYEVERTGPTRIYPYAKYKVNFAIKANEDFQGNVIESVPNSFAVTQSENYQVVYGESENKILWPLDLKAGDSINLSYEFDAPDISPELYLLGPLEIDDWQEARFWQTAADATAAYDFVGCGTTCDTSTDWWASQDDVDQFPFGGVQANRNTHTEATDAQFDLIESSNDSRWTSADPGAGDQTLLWAEMKIDQTPTSITQIDLTYEGALANGDASSTGNIWVLKTGAAYEADANWVQVGTDINLTTTEASFTRSITANFSDYIGANGILTWVVDNNASSTSLTSDYVQTLVTYTPSPTLNQNHYRWRDDTTALNTDGGYLAAEDTLYSPLKKNTTARLRVEVANTGEAAATSYNYRLQSALLNGTCGASTFADVPVTATTEAWEMVASSQYADGDTITASRLTATGTFVNGVAVEDPSNQTAAFSLTNGNYTEFEYAIQATSNAVDSGTYCFRTTNAGSTTNFTYSIYPQITLDTGGGRLFSSGFELQSVTADVEWTTVNGSPAISTATRRGGDAALQVSSLSSGTQKRTNYQFKSSNSNGPFFARGYLNIATAPSAENRIMSFRDSGGTDRAYITLDSGRLLRLYDEDGVIGSASSALSLNTWYRVELKIDASGGVSSDTVEAKLDGTNIATSSTRDLTNGVTQIVIGGNLNSETQTTGEWYFDDIAVNENAGSSQNSYPGSGAIIHLRPNGDGDTVAWTNTYTNIDEVTPNDATDSITSTTVNQIEEVNLFDPDSVGMRSTDTINVLQIGTRFRSSSATNSTATVRVKSKSNGTLLESSGIATSGTTWFTNGNTAPRTYPLSSYTNPEGGAWTPSNLITTQIGAKLTVDGGTNTYQISTMWLLVDYAPAANSPDNQTQYDATHDTVIATGGSTTDGVTTNLFLDSYVFSSFKGETFTPKVEVRDVSTSFSNAATHTGQPVVYDSKFPDDIRSTCIVKDELNNQLVMWGGQTGTATKAPTNDTWVLSLEPGYRSQWKLLTTSGTKPQANRAHVCVYDALNDRLVVFGGWNGSAYLNVPWFLSLPSSGTPTWTQPTVTNSPPSATGQLQAVAVYDSSPSRMIIYGGYFSTDTDIDQVYELTLPNSGNPTWNQVIGTTAGTPSASGAGRDGGTLVYDSDSDRAVLYGGHINAITNEVWSLNLSAGSEAWTQITPTGNAGVRYGHMAGLQADYTGTDDRMIVYSGSTGDTSGFLDDVWELALPEAGGGTWTDKSPATGNRPLPARLGGLNGVYDANGSNGPRMLFVPGFDGTNFDSGIPLAIDLPTSGTFEYKKLADMRTLTARDQDKMELDPINGDIVAFGGACCGDGPTYAYHESETWKFDVSDNSWRDAGPDMAPIVREAGITVYDSTTGSERMVYCFGLSNAQPNYLNDCWQLSLPTTGKSKWTNLNPSGTLPEDRWAAASAYDDLNDRMVVFGGQGGSGNSYLNDLNFLSLGASPAWSVPTVSGTPPSARRFATAIYDPARDRMIIFGGQSSTTVFNEVWQLTLPSAGNPTWSQLSPSGTAPSARNRQVAVYDPDRGDGVARMVMFGGVNNGTTHNNEVWELTLPASGDGAWTQLSPSGTIPAARRSHAAAYDSTNDRMILFGGRNTASFFGDTWSLSLGSSPAWTQLMPDVKLPATVSVSGLTAGTSYHWQAWATGSSSGDSSKTAYGGNSDTPPAGTDFSIAP